MIAISADYPASGNYVESEQSVLRSMRKSRKLCCVGRVLTPPEPIRLERGVNASLPVLMGGSEVQFCLPNVRAPPIRRVASQRMRSFRRMGQYLVSTFTIAKARLADSLPERALHIRSFCSP